MKLPLSWIRDYVDIKISPEEIAERLTFAGLEVEQIDYIGLPRRSVIPPITERPDLAWDREKNVVGKILAVNPHPNADRLTLAMVDIGKGDPIQVVTGAPNIKVGESGYLVAFALEGATLFDGHQDGWKPMTLKKSKIRGIESGCMVCSEKELGISDEHEGIILLPDDAPVGAPLADYLGDVVYNIKINPNMSRCSSVIGIAREVAAVTGQSLREVPTKVVAKGAPIADQIKIVIKNPELNPRFTAALIRDVAIKPSPFWMQQRLKLAGMRPINNIVDVTNYVMIEAGQPLHAFDYDKLIRRAQGGRAQGIAPTIITRLAEPGEEIETLDGAKRKLDPFTILVCDTRGALSIGGVMGGADSEVDAQSKNILLEAASWEYLNIRRTVQSQHLPSEAAARFSRGIHPSQAVIGLKRAIEMMRELGGGEIAKGIVDEYPAKPKKVVISLPIAEVKRQLGVEIPAKEITRLLESVGFKVEKQKAKGKLPITNYRITAPDHRLDVDGTDDVIEEIARLYGYANIPVSRMDDELPPQHTNVDLEQEEQVRDLLIDAGLQDVVTYALTTPEREAMLSLDAAHPAIPPRQYVRIENPISAERAVMRQSLVPNLIDLASANLRYRARVAMFEVGLVYWNRDSNDALLPRESSSELPEDHDRALPLERRRLAIVLTGPRDEMAWQGADKAQVDFYDLKGIVEALIAGLHIGGTQFVPANNPLYHPGRAAMLKIGDAEIGVLGELHPLVREKFDLPARAVLIGEFDLDVLLARVQAMYKTRALARYPAVAQDLAIVVDEKISADRVHALIAQTGGALLASATLFDVYRGDQIASGKKSLAYALMFQSDERTLTDDDATKLRGKIVQRLQRELGAEVRGA